MLTKFFLKNNNTHKPNMRYTAIPKAMVTFNDSLVPSIGISAITSDIFTISCEIPSTSLPIIKAILFFS